MKNNKKSTKENIIDVSNRKNILIINYDIENISDNEYKKMLNTLNNISKDIKISFYSSNITIQNTYNRTFFDLLKLFYYYVSLNFQTINHFIKNTILRPTNKT